MTAPMGLQTFFGYDSDGNQVTDKDPRAGSRRPCSMPSIARLW